MGSRILLIGSRGTIGRRLGTSLERQSPCPVRLVSSQDCNFEVRDEVEQFFGRLDPGAYTVIFLAVILRTREDSYEAFTRNVLMVKHLMEGLRRITVRGLLYFSSSDVYGRPPAVPLTEESPVDPDTWYGLAKYVGECLVRRGGRGRFPVSVLRLPGVYGPGLEDRSVIGRLLCEMARTGRVQLDGYGMSLRDYVHVDDVTALVRRLVDATYDGTLNVATGQSLSIRQLCHAIGETLGVACDVLPGTERTDRSFDLVFDTRRLSSVFPDFQFTPLREGLASCRDALRVEPSLSRVPQGPARASGG